MDAKHAAQIADLINTRNQLVKKYTSKGILESAQNYLYKTEDGVVVACIEAKRVQWYQWEVCHLSVHSQCEGKGFGSSMIHEAEQHAIEKGARIIQCTIRVGNVESERVFSRNGYQRTVAFYYPPSGNMVAVWQKVVSTRSEIF